MAENRDNWNKSVQERIAKDKAALLEHLRKMPILQVALERAGLSRSTYYHWRDEDAEFRKAADEAIKDGEALITDMSESQLVAMIKERHFPAVQLWLRHHHPKYAPRLELDATINTIEELSPEQKELVDKALKLANISLAKVEEKITVEQNDGTTDSNTNAESNKSS